MSFSSRSSATENSINARRNPRRRRRDQNMDMLRRNLVIASVHTGDVLKLLMNAIDKHSGGQPIGVKAFTSLIQFFGTEEFRDFEKSLAIFEFLKANYDLHYRTGSMALAFMRDMATTQQEILPPWQCPSPPSTSTPNEDASASASASASVTHPLGAARITARSDPATPAGSPSALEKQASVENTSPPIRDMDRRTMTYAYTTIISCAARSRRAAEGLYLFDEMKEAKIPPNVRTYSAVLSCAARVHRDGDAFSKCYEYYQQMLTDFQQRATDPIDTQIDDNDTVVDHVVYAMLLNGCIKQRLADEAIVIYESMMLGGRPPATGTCIYSSERDRDKELPQSVKRMILQIDESVYLRLLDLVASTGNMRVMKGMMCDTNIRRGYRKGKTMAQMDSKMRPAQFHTKHHCNIMLRCCAIAGDTAFANGVLQWMRKEEHDAIRFGRISLTASGRGAMHDTAPESDPSIMVDSKTLALMGCTWLAHMRKMRDDSVGEGISDAKAKALRFMQDSLRAEVRERGAGESIAEIEKEYRDYAVEYHVPPEDDPDFESTNNYVISYFAWKNDLSDMVWKAYPICCW